VRALARDDRGTGRTDQRSVPETEEVHRRHHRAHAELRNGRTSLQEGGRQGRYAEAEALFKRSLAIWEKALGADHPHVALSLNNLAVLYRIQGQDGQAEPLCKRSLGIREKALGPVHPHVAESLENLARLYGPTNRMKEAEVLEKRAAAMNLEDGNAGL